MKATVVGIYGAYYQVRPEGEHFSRKIILAKTRGKLRLEKKTTSYLEPRERHLLTIGDVVEIQVDDGEKDEANIIELYPRKNSFQRATIYQKQTLGANLTAVIMISSMDCPVINGGLLARLLVETALCKIKPILILNKMDFHDKNKKTEYIHALEIMQYFEKQNFRVFYESFNNGISKKLRNEITPGRYLAFGESGVGKSTFINQMLGKKIQATDMTEIVLKGRHVTTNPVLYEMEGSIELIDVPGIREFGLMHRTKFEIASGFHEFNDIKCRFDNCLHLDEPDCGVKLSLQQHDFPQFRYEQYCNIMKSMLENWKPRRGDMRNLS
ncbi:MAG: ribosome small subunit-dependent GTPase A [Spirochaetia bacterium]|nr:ribosome small subunit-dependent GTPase A [Spirochaetia bacterium]